MGKQAALACALKHVAQCETQFAGHKWLFGTIGQLAMCLSAQMVNGIVRMV